MNIIIREICKEEYYLLKDFLYEAIFVPKGIEKPLKSIVENDELQVYIRDFGKIKDDICLVVECDNRIIGACWTRIVNDYGHINNETPSLAISIFEEYRGKGMGTKLMKAMIKLLKEKGYKQVSLSVQKENYAVEMYKKIGFKIVDEKELEYIMLYKLVSQ
ncbi:MAG: GNAT family N-acetyltransferase [Eubacterium sp.]